MHTDPGGAGDVTWTEQMTTKEGGGEVPVQVQPHQELAVGSTAPAHAGSSSLPPELKPGPGERGCPPRNR